MFFHQKKDPFSPPNWGQICYTLALVEGSECQELGFFQIRWHEYEGGKPGDIKVHDEALRGKYDEIRSAIANVVSGKKNSKTGAVNRGIYEICADPTLQTVENAKYVKDQFLKLKELSKSIMQAAGPNIINETKSNPEQKKATVQ